MQCFEEEKTGLDPGAQNGDSPGANIVGWGAQLEDEENDDKYEHDYDDDEDDDDGSEEMRR